MTNTIAAAMNAPNSAQSPSVTIGERTERRDALGEARVVEVALGARLAGQRGLELVVEDVVALSALACSGCVDRADVGLLARVSDRVADDVRDASARSVPVEQRELVVVALRGARRPTGSGSRD